ncbi:MAG: hypothetical protein WAQ52_15315 [Terriglobales bacterium]
MLDMAKEFGRTGIEVMEFVSSDETPHFSPSFLCALLRSVRRPEGQNAE